METRNLLLKQLKENLRLKLVEQKVDISLFDKVDELEVSAIAAAITYLDNNKFLTADNVACLKPYISSIFHYKLLKV